MIRARMLKTLLAFAGALPACAATGADAPNFVIGGTPVGTFDLPVSSMLDHRFNTVVRQQYDFSCGSAALATLLRYHYGARATEGTVFDGMWAEGDQAMIRQQGFSLLDMKRYLASVGLAADGYKVTLDQLAKTGVPGVALTTTDGYRHFVVIKGVTADEVLVGDPSRGLQVYDREAFGKMWDGIFFVVTDSREFARRHFNRPVQWEAYIRAPIDGAFADPVSLQALQLVAPFYSDF